MLRSIHGTALMCMNTDSIHIYVLHTTCGCWASFAALPVCSVGGWGERKVEGEGKKILSGRAGLLQSAQHVCGLNDAFFFFFSSATLVEVAGGRFSTRLKWWEAIERVWLLAGAEWGICPQTFALQYPADWLACSHCHRNRVPECSGGSLCSGARQGTDREESDWRRDTEREREREKWCVRVR